MRLDGHDYKVVGVLDEWAPTPKFYDLNNGSFDEIEELFVPYGIGQQLEMQSAGNTNCWRNQEINNFQDFINSDCVWIQFWVELHGGEKARGLPAVHRQLRARAEVDRAASSGR